LRARHPNRAGTESTVKGLDTHDELRVNAEVDEPSIGHPIWVAGIDDLGSSRCQAL
jgi:hypothetical protein